jgi:seryl-tRNA synthetase
MAAFRAATAEQAAYLRDLLAKGHLVQTGVPGVYGQGADFVRVRDAFTDAVARAAAPDRAEPMRFPPLLSRLQIETNGYLGSFPHLAGSVFSFEGSDAEALELEARAARHEDWSSFQTMTELVVLPAACYPVYPELAKRGLLPRSGATVDTGSSWVFRHEASDDPARMQSFHMYELVRVGDPDDVADFRNSWLPRAVDLFRRLGLETNSELATDPFFGRVGRMLAANQRAQELKFELVALVGGPEPTAIASFNYHQDHFTQVYQIGIEGGGVAHTGCVAFGIERVTLALFRANGLDLDAWPQEVRAELWP